MATVTTARSVAPSTSSNSFSVASRTLTKLDCTGNDSFPAGLRVLVVDDDPICLLILDRMLQRCQYKVTTCGRAADALAMLRENREAFDVIISDVYMPDMDGFKLLELVGLEMDLPVIMMSANGETSAVMKGIKHGACDYLLKPVRMEELRNIWQHVIRKKWRSSTHLAVSDDDERGRHARNDGDHHSSGNEGYDMLWKPGKKRRESKEEEDDNDVDPEDSSATKKPRVVWSVELHQQFVNAVHQLGIDKAFPKRILELMNVNGLTRENVASHLQKYRLYLKRINGVAHQSGAMSPSFPVSSDSSFGPTSAVTGGNVGDFRAIAGSNGLPSEALLAGVLGRLNQGNNVGIGNVEKPSLLQLAALQGIDTSTLNQAPFVPSYGQTASNDMAVLQTGQCDVSPVQLAQLGALTGIALDKLPLGLSSLQQLPLQSAVGLGALGQLLGAGNFPQVNPNNSAFVMQALQQQQGGNHSLSKNGLSGSGGQLGTLTDAGAWVTANSGLNGNVGVHNPLPLQYSVSSRLCSTAGACPGPPTMPGPLPCAPGGDQECEGQQGLSTDARVRGPSLSTLNRADLNGVGNAVNVIGSQNSRLMEIGSSVSSGPGSLEKPYDVESKCSLIPNHGNAVHMNPFSVSSSMAVSGTDNLFYNRMKDLNCALPSLNPIAPQNPGPRFPAFPGIRQAPQVSQRAQGIRPGFGSSQDFVQAPNSTIQTPGYSSRGSSTNQGVPLMSDQEQSDVCGAGLNSGFVSDFNIDSNHVNNFQVDQLTTENISKVGLGGHGWGPEPISDELLSFVLQQQQEGLGLTE